MKLNLKVKSQIRLVLTLLSSKDWKTGFIHMSLFVCLCGYLGGRVELFNCFIGLLGVCSLLLHLVNINKKTLCELLTETKPTAVFQPVFYY